MNKKNFFVFLMISAVLITVGYLVISLTIGGSSGSVSDSSGMPIGTFFTVFILPGIVLQQKKRREQKKMQQQHEEEL